jgi:hypothetical protein
MAKRIKPEMIGEALGLKAQAVRVAMQQGKLDLGVAYKPTGREYVYIIYPEKARAIVGETKMREWGF